MREIPCFSKIFFLTRLDSCVEFFSNTMIYVYVIKFPFLSLTSKALHIAAKAKLSGPPETPTKKLLDLLKEFFFKI